MPDRYLITRIHETLKIVTTMCNNLSNWGYRKSSLTAIHGRLAIPSFLCPIYPCWCLMAFGPYPLSLATHGPNINYGLRPYSAVISVLGQFSTHRGSNGKKEWPRTQESRTHLEGSKKKKKQQ
ncbi:hypothetical protein O181_019527 [Austropuccinia psidii MF-1]|uniref:Uncharacterized protein n=1 Tax=Austropuccinia psidii MF-1 TaxID=1389203 RepID=A0A9Q3C9W8_9BASI|nr:hypothetical protein [Austropuccinia psidii MF-1]